MNNAVFVGLYAAREARAGILPTNSASGMWQAWSMPDGKYMIQPLDFDKKPSGSLSLMDGKEFMGIFDPLEVNGENSIDPREPGFPAQGISASAPDLLTQWYLQDFSSETVSAEVIGNINMDEYQELKHIVIRPADYEPELTSVADPFFTDSENAVQAMDESPKAAGKAKIVKTTQAKVSPAKPNDAISSYRNHLESLKLDEAGLRKEFYRIVDKMADNSNAAAEDECALFLQHDFGDIPNQAFLFTEFGLALRREKHLALALFSHLKALNFSPEDANILFNIARTNYDLGKFEEARKYLTRALTVAPDFDTARNFLNFLNSST